MKITYSCVARSLIALLFVVAGYQKLVGFAAASGFIGSLLGLSSPMLAGIATALVIIVEIPVAIAFAWGYRICTMGMILIGFTVVATALVHNHLPADLVMILKNIAIIGGILAATCACPCGKCPMGKGCEKCDVK